MVPGLEGTAPGETSIGGFDSRGLSGCFGGMYDVRAANNKLLINQ